MALNTGWTNHLLSTRSALRALIARMRSIAVAGTSPSGAAGQPLTPLPEEEWQRLEQGLHAIVAEVNALVEALAPDEAARSEQRQPVTATRYHVSLLLRELDQNVLADLDPGRGSRYGKITPREADRLTSALASIRQHLRQVQDDMEGART